MCKRFFLAALVAVLLTGSVTPSYTYAAENKKEQEVTVSEDDEADEKDEEELNLKEETLIVKKSEFVADSFKGVDAIYRPGKNDGSSATYSCAAYIKKFYSSVYDVSVYNLFAGNTPKTYEGNTFSKVSNPKVGDIAFSKSHWAIVKSVDKENKKVVLIEQNWKWSQGRQTVCKINRTVSTSSLTYYRLDK